MQNTRLVPPSPRGEFFTAEEGPRWKLWFGYVALLRRVSRRSYHTSSLTQHSSHSLHLPFPNLPRIPTPHVSLSQRPPIATTETPVPPLFRIISLRKTRKTRSIFSLSLIGINSRFSRKMVTRKNKKNRGVPKNVIANDDLNANHRRSSGKDKFLVEGWKHTEIKGPVEHKSSACTEQNVIQKSVGWKWQQADWRVMSTDPEVRKRKGGSSGVHVWNSFVTHRHSPRGRYPVWEPASRPRALRISMHDRSTGRVTQPNFFFSLPPPVDPRFSDPQPAATYESLLLVRASFLRARIPPVIAPHL